jgi:hypothetical protein
MLSAPVLKDLLKNAGEIGADFLFQRFGELGPEVGRENGHGSAYSFTKAKKASTAGLVNLVRGGVGRAGANEVAAAGRRKRMPARKATQT